MAPNGFLFVNKHSNSPSLSRNTGSEAPLASKVNKHVQQQRFWKSSGQRRIWYRPFVRSNSSGPTTPLEIETWHNEDVNDYGRSARSSLGQSSPTLSSPRRRKSSHRKSIPRSCPSKSPDTDERLQTDARPLEVLDPIRVLVSRPGDSSDPFSTAIVQITPILRAALDKHFRWVVSSSVSDFGVREGVSRIFDVVLTHRMHSAAFLAMATAQQRKTNNVFLPYDHSPEYYSYTATKMIREYIESRPVNIDSYTFVDIFRLAMCEWINGNHGAARIHFSYIARNFNDFKPDDEGDNHNIEVISSEDIFLAIDVDAKPLLALKWMRNLPTVPAQICSGIERRSQASGNEQNSNKLLEILGASSSLTPILRSLLTHLQAHSNFSDMDFTSATRGPIWATKRRMHVALHRLQSVEGTNATIDSCIRRTMLILLFLASTTPARRVGRTDLARLAKRLRESIQCSEANRAKNTTTGEQASCLSEPSLWLWMYITGSVAATEEPKHEEDVRWFRHRAMMSVVQLCGAHPQPGDVEGILGHYMTFKNVHQNVVQELCKNIAAQVEGRRDGSRSIGFRVVDGPL